MSFNRAINLVGILNVTPDSFSDGGRYYDAQSAICHARELIGQGAAIVEIGGDSTRPGSTCVGIEEEWRRIEPVLNGISGTDNVCVDTHHAETAKRALQLGVKLINDISAGADPKMFEYVAKSSAKIILMYSASAPHDFSHLEKQSPQIEALIKRIRTFFIERVRSAKKAGIPPDDIIIDTGIGAYLSSDRALSWNLLQRMHEFSDLNSSLMLAVSRKGFLKTEQESSIEDRDSLSALCAALVNERWRSARPLFIRAHNLNIHKYLLNSAN